MQQTIDVRLRLAAFDEEQRVWWSTDHSCQCNTTTSEMNAAFHANSFIY